MVTTPGSTGRPPLASLAGHAVGVPPQRKVVSVLVGGQILGGIGMGATLSLGSLLAAQLSGSPAWSGMAATMSTLGAAVAAVPLARLAVARGRRMSLSTGALIAGTGAVIAITSASVSVFPLLLLGLMLLGAGSAVNLQARFAATDLARPGTRARDLSIVVWSTTIGAVLGPNLFGPGEAVGSVLGLPPLTGAFAFSVAAQLAAALVYLTGLRPDPLLAAMSLRELSVEAPRPRSGSLILRSNPGARYAVAAVALSHATMVALMSMTPVHLREHGASLVIVGFTISLHIAGMYALSPVFGWLADKAGRLRVVLLGQAMLLASLLIAGVAADSRTGVTVSLVLLGLGWSASVVAGSAMVAESVHIQDRPAIQGLSDLSMNAAGALGGALAGPVLASVGYSGLGFLAMALVAVVVIWTLLHGRRASAHAKPVTS
ncbi:MFS transporter [Arthrobacter sp. PAMC25564]|uniref:MFS transporter n=1 Tax=Arthrobacter sp. PAMC25564 TaxID=2565366 RepID=UPI0010A2294A|nr:MFS transporter [Arthrobacter sp. PAMC25564]QCB97467.1 MFS transporter [Arthrobacter sp. PAMC25564]